MKFLFDHNLSHRLVRSLSSLYPDSAHVRDVACTPKMMNRYGTMQPCMALSSSLKMPDFHQRSFVRGAPPKVIWIRLGNCRTNQIEALLRAHVQEVEAFTRDEEATFLALG